MEIDMVWSFLSAGRMIWPVLAPEGKMKFHNILISSAPSSLQTGFIAKHDVIWYGISLWSVWVSCLGYVSFQPVANPQTTGLWGPVRNSGKTVAIARVGKDQGTAWKRVSTTLLPPRQQPEFGPSLASFHLFDLWTHSFQWVTFSLNDVLGNLESQCQPAPRHPLLAKAEPTSDGGSASGITCLRRGKAACFCSQERGVRICESNNPADTKASEEGGGGGAPGAGAEIPLQPMVKPMVRQAVPLQPMEVNGGADLHLQPMEVNGGADLHLQPMEVNGGADLHLQPM
ncbi:hypothetical protein QYF61_004772 [Mycteria americana]|uniref:Uncharacterized protein n=1 Tax=Mycteria americana TaxID=33587 RepID=A0AAN7NQ21_MYCAM|nr:hypothetical protein QYF61_004772 [Mycteria americana]